MGTKVRVVTGAAAEIETSVVTLQMCTNIHFAVSKSKSCCEPTWQGVTASGTGITHDGSGPSNVLSSLGWLVMSGAEAVRGTVLFFLAEVNSVSVRGKRERETGDEIPRITFLHLFPLFHRRARRRRPSNTAASVWQASLILFILSYFSLFPAYCLFLLLPIYTHL